MRIPEQLLILLTLSVLACGHADDGNTGGNEAEVITTVILEFTPAGGGTAIVAEFDDPDGDGGNAPTVDDAELAAGSYTLSVRFENRLETPSEDITREVADEGDEHLVFFTGSGVTGPASDQPGAPLTHNYDDEDTSGLPIGLQNTIEASLGTGELIVTLRHLPEIGGEAQKTANTTAEVRAAGFSAIGGTSDAQVTFPVTVF